MQFMCTLSYEYLIDHRSQLHSHFSDGMLYKQDCIRIYFSEFKNCTVRGMSLLTFVISLQQQSAVGDLSDMMSLLAGSGLLLYHCGTSKVKRVCLPVGVAVIIRVSSCIMLACL